jgi:hypothetical protein
MTFTESYLALKKQVAEQLAKQGWNLVDGISMENTATVATKDFETAVGTKTAIAYLMPSSESTGYLNADYQSEGRNVLSTVWHTIGHIYCQDDVVTASQAFTQQVNKIVGDSYAMRLMASAQA